MCEACGKHFPAKQFVAGRLRSLYRRKFCLECSPFGGHNTSKKPTEPKEDETLWSFPLSMIGWGLMLAFLGIVSYRIALARSKPIGPASAAVFGFLLLSSSVDRLRAGVPAHHPRLSRLRHQPIEPALRSARRPRRRPRVRPAAPL